MNFEMLKSFFLKKLTKIY